MTDEEVRIKTEQLIDRCAENMKKSITEALTCGGLSRDRYKDDYLMPRVILTALLMKERDRYIPDSEAWTADEVKNLYLMV